MFTTPRNFNFTKRVFFIAATLKKESLRSSKTFGRRTVQFKNRLEESGGRRSGRREEGHDRPHAAGK